MAPAFASWLGRAKEDGGQIADFELRNWEPARRVGVQRTISDFIKGQMNKRSLRFFTVSFSSYS